MYRARRRTDGARVVMKSTSCERPSHEACDLLRHEFDVLRRLDGQGVPKVVALEEEEQGRLVLVLEDDDDRAHHRLEAPVHDVREFLVIVIGVLRALEHVHVQGFLHLDIKPSNVIYHADSSSIKLIDFGSAVPLHRASEVGVTGTMGYMSPEQIGRTSRHVDERSDLYALGMMCYELLSGELPFNAQDETGWATCHTSVTPPSLRDVVEDLPVVLASIVHRLIQKDPDRRYQSASGALYDMMCCLEQLEGSGQIMPFALGTHDYDARLVPSTTLASPHDDIAASLVTLWKTREASLIWLHGAAGVGTRAIIDAAIEAHGELQVLEASCEREGVVVESLLTRWVDQILLSSDESTGQRAMMATLSAAQQALAISRVPLLARLCAPPPAGYTLEQEPARADLVELWVELWSMIMTERARLVVLDRAALLDATSQEVFTRLMMAGRLRDAHLVCLEHHARDHAVLPVPDHLIDFVHVPELSMQAMGEVVARWFSGQLPCAHTIEHLFERVGGYPERARMWLVASIRQGALRQHRTTGAWQWRAGHPASVHWPEALVEMAVQDLLELPEQAGRLRDLLITGMEHVTEQVLWDELASEHVPQHLRVLLDTRHVRRADGALVFSQPRVVERLMQSLDQSSLRHAHHSWARQLLSRGDAEDVELCQRLFAHERHTWRLEDERGRGEVLGRVARAAKGWLDSSDHMFASEAISCALEILAGQPEHIITAYRSRLYAWDVQCRYYSGDVDGALGLCAQIDRTGWDRMDRAEFAHIEALILSQRGEYEASLKVAFDALSQFGMDLPREPELLQRALPEALGVMRAHLERVPPEQLHTLECARDERHHMVFELLVSVAPAAFQTSAALFALIELTLFDLSIRWGLTPRTVQCLGPCGMIAHSILDDHDLAVRLGEAAVRVAEHFSPHPAEGVAWFVNGACLFHLRYTPARTLQVLDRAHELCVRFEDHEHGAYAAHQQIVMRRLTGHTLAQVYAQIERSLAFCHRVGALSNARVIRYYEASLGVLTMTHRMSDALQMNAELREEHIERSGMPDTNTCVSYIETAYAAYWSDDIVLAWEAICKARALAEFVQGLIIEYHVHIYSGMIAAAYLARAAPGDEVAREVLEQSWALIARVAEHNPEMYGAVFEILSGERALLQHESIDVVIAHYGDCARLAGSRFLQWRALALERQAELWHRHGQSRLVRAFADEAFELYEAWGCVVRCKRIERRYDEVARRLDLVRDARAHERLEPASSRRSTTRTRTFHDVLDMQAVLRGTQAIAGAMRSERLYETLLSTMMEHAGAEHGSLILCQDDRDTLVASLPYSGQGSFVASALWEAEHIAHEVVAHCRRHHKPIVLGDACRDARFGTNPAIRARAVQSLLCVPIMERGALLGILYLENNLMTHAFSAQHLRVLNLLAGQAAISLQNTMMFQNLEQQVQARTRQLDEQNREIRTLFDHLPHAVLTLDEELLIEPRYSAHTCVILGSREDFVGKTLEETLFTRVDICPEEISRARAVLEFGIGAPMFMAQMNWSHLPGKLERRLEDGTLQHLVIEWSPIANDADELCRVMLTIRDETKLLELEQSAQEHARELEILNQLLSAGLRDFQEFSFNARQRLNENHLMGDEDNLHDDAILALLFRNFHTIKGNARLLGLDLLSQAAHLAEEPISELRQIPAEARDWDQIEPAAEAIEAALHAFIAVLHEYEEVLAENFGELLQENHAVDSHVVARLRAEVARGLQDPGHAVEALQSMHMLLSNAEAVSLEHLVTKTSRLFTALSTELGKPIPRVELTGESVWMGFGFSSILHDALIHVFRNAFDHGIEPPEQRLHQGKPEQGLVHIQATRHTHGIRLEIWDDGAGLALPKLRQMAEDPGLDDEQVAAMIFESGRSTASEVSEISGRGVGMDAVRTFLEKEDCAISLRWRDDGPDARGHRAFALCIEIPSSRLFDMH